MPEVSCQRRAQLFAVFEYKYSDDLPANTQLLSPRASMDNGTTPAAVVYDY